MIGCGRSRNTANCFSSGNRNRTVATFVAADLKHMMIADYRNCFEIKCISKQFFIFAAKLNRNYVNTEIQNGRNGFREEAA